MKKTRRRYDRAFKISVVADLESGKPLAQIAREHSIHPGLPSRWREELAENPEKAFSGNGNQLQEAGCFGKPEMFPVSIPATPPAVAAPALLGGLLSLLVS